MNKLWFFLVILECIWTWFNVSKYICIHLLFTQCTYCTLLTIPVENLLGLDKKQVKLVQMGRDEIFSGRAWPFSPQAVSRTCACYTSHHQAPTATYMIVSHRSHRGTSHVVPLNHIQVDHTVFTTNHIYATIASTVGNNLSPLLFAPFILSQCDSPISHIGSAVNSGFEVRHNCWISYWISDVGNPTVGFHIGWIWPVTVTLVHSVVPDKTGPAELLSPGI